MPSVLRVALATLLSSLRSRRGVALENLARRHQLAVIHGTAPPRLRLARIVWVVLSRLFDEWGEALIMVKPVTVVRWHGAAFR